MAKSFPALLLVASLLIACQQRPAQIDPLPVPNLDAPLVEAPAPTPATQPASPATPIAAASTVSASRSISYDIPAAWIPADWIPAAPAHPWRWIVIHHSATATGSAESFDRMHRSKGWDELGYHFVIGNGTSTADGQVEVGPRWTKQKAGAHARTPDNRYNDFGIGICLVGNFDVDRPTAAQMTSLSRLLAHLMKSYSIPVWNVMGHCETKPTDCPGRNVSVAAIRRSLSAVAAMPAPAAASPARPADARPDLRVSSSPILATPAHAATLSGVR